MVGNLCNFTKIDVLRCLLKIDKHISRASLSKKLELGEGTIRAILNILAKNQLLKSDKKGHYLSAKGIGILKKIDEVISIKEVYANCLKSNKNIKNKNIMGVQIKSAAKIEKPYVLRDEALKNGAEGALILKYDKALKLYDLDYNEDFSKIEKQFDLKKGDIIIIAYANSLKLAEHGALAAAIGISNYLNSLLKQNFAIK